MEFCSAGSRCCLFGPLIKVVRHECFWPLTTEILHTEREHDDFLWMEVIYSPVWCQILICDYFFVFHVDELKEKLLDFVSETNSQRPGFIKMVRHAKQEGLIRSRVSGWRAATAPVVALFDAHVEFNVGW